MTSSQVEQASKSTRTESEVRTKRTHGQCPTCHHYGSDCTGPHRYRIRRCKGNQSAWCLISLRADGTEIESHGGYKTALSLDSLLADPRSPSPRSGDNVEFVL